MGKSYFAILGVTTNASSEEIRSAYRRLAKELHPDRVGGDSGAFRQVQEAYSILKDDVRRQAYEQSLAGSSRWVGSRRYPPPEPVGRRRRGPVRHHSTMEALLDELFGILEGDIPVRPRQERMQNLILEVPFTMEMARRGGSVEVTVPVRSVCSACEGHGGRGYYACSRCLGQGVILEELPLAISLPPGLDSTRTVVISLERFGLRNVQLTVYLVEA
jgi:molecular chaperone DnaJ